MRNDRLNPLQPAMSGLYRNPEGTLPMPSPGSDIPVPYYEGSDIYLAWSLVAGDPNTYTASWRTPVFNLRPDLRSAGNVPKFGVPIWSTAARLYIQVDGLTSSSAKTTQGLRVTSEEFASVAQGDNQDLIANLKRVTAPVDVTGDFMLGINQPDRVVLVFAPLGEGRPVRFWSVQLTFTKDAVDWASDQRIRISAAYY
jgi:hypothetical protein